MLSNSSSPLGRIARGTGAYSISVLANKLTGLLLLPTYTHYLTPSDYGIAELVELTFYVIGTLIGIRITDSLAYHFSKADTDDERGRTVGSCYLTAVCLSLLAFLIGYSLSPHLSRLVLGSAQYTRYFQLSWIGFALSLPVELGFAFIRIIDRPKLYAIVSFVQVALMATINVIALSRFGLGLEGIMWSKIIVFSTVGSVMAVYALTRFRLGAELQIVWKLVRYSVPLGFAGLGFLMVHFGDRFFLKQYVSFTELGIYALAYKLGMLVSYIDMPFQTYWSSQRFILMRGEGGDSLFARVCTYETLVVGGAFVALSAASGPLVRIFADERYASAAVLVPWIAAAYVVRTLAAQFRTVFLVGGRPDLEARVVLVGAGVCLAGYAALIPYLHLWGAVAATFMGFVAMLVYGFYHAQRLKRYPYEYRRLSAVGVASLVCVLLSLSTGFVAGPYAAAAVGIAAFPCVLAALGFLDSHEKALLTRALRAMAIL